MKHNRMSLKKANMISSAQKSATSNPFIVFGFYDILEKVMSEKQFLSSNMESDNGWMNTQFFHQWFEKFCSQVNERPLLIIYNGHLSHVSISLIGKAREEDITILKLPPHVRYSP